MQRLLVASVAAGTLIFQVACYGSGFSLPDNRQHGRFEGDRSKGQRRRRVTGNSYIWGGAGLAGAKMPPRRTGTSPAHTTRQRADSASGTGRQRRRPQPAEPSTWRSAGNSTPSSAKLKIGP